MSRDPSSSVRTARRQNLRAVVGEEEAFVGELRKALSGSESLPLGMASRLVFGVRDGLGTSAGFLERAAVYASMAFVVVGFSLQGSMTPRIAAALGAATLAVGLTAAVLTRSRDDASGR